MLLKLVLIILIFIVLAIFVAQNVDQKVIFKMFNIQFQEFPAVYIVLFSILMGIILTFPIYLKLKRIIRKQKKEIKKLKKSSYTPPKLLTHDK